jgi:hypothetical protein
MLSARFTFPFKDKVTSTFHLMDYDVNRYAQKQFPVDYRVFSDPSQLLTTHEENQMKSDPFHKSVLNFTLKYVLGRTKSK